MSAVERIRGDNLLHVESSGRGEDVILLHGWGMHSGYWQGLVERLKGTFRLHCIDLPGHGKSAYHQEGALDDFVQRVRRTIAAVTAGEFHLIGWSLGGLISQGLTLADPEPVKRLVLIASSPSFRQRDDWPCGMPETVLNGFATDLVQDYQTTLKRFLALQVRGSQQQQQGLRELKAQLFSRGEPVPAALSAGLSLLREVDLRQAVSHIDKPVLLLGGERDTLVSPAAVTATAQQISQADMQLIKGAGHAPFLSQPEAAANIIRTFLGHD